MVGENQFARLRFDYGLTINVNHLAGQLPSQGGHTFSGWFIDSDLTTPFSQLAITQNHTLYGALNPIVYHTITFYIVHDGFVSDNTETLLVRHGTTPQLMTPSLEGYRFVGWYTDRALTNRHTEAPITGDLSLYARWERIATGCGTCGSITSMGTPLGLGLLILVIGGLVFIVLRKNKKRTY
jgi:uncharacterized repeat protein (TIGR02543 family)